MGAVDTGVGEEVGEEVGDGVGVGEGVGVCAWSVTSPHTTTPATSKARRDILRAHFFIVCSSLRLEIQEPIMHDLAMQIHLFRP